MIQTSSPKSNIQDEHLGYWEIHNNTVYWSSAFVKRLGYKSQEMPADLSFFLDVILFSEHRQLFQDNFFNLVNNSIDFDQHILLKEASGRFSEYVCKSKVRLPVKKREGSIHIYFFKSKLTTHDKVKEGHFYYRETASMTSTGSWYIDFEKRKTYWDRITRGILRYPEDFIPSLKLFEKICPRNYQKEVNASFIACATKGTPFEHIMEIHTRTRKKKWVRVKGKPVFNKAKQIVGIRGIVQDIDDLKRYELKLLKTSKIIESQNSRLFNFAHIVSHNLRSHSSNLALIVELLKELQDPSEKMELLGHIGDVSESLNSTIEHLNEVVSIQTKGHEQLELVSLEKTLDQVCKSIRHIIETKKAVIVSDFSEAPHVKYIPAYMDSILLNMITNAIKYKHQDRDPHIHLKSYLDTQDEIVLEISDNGQGIDLEKFGDKMFGMYNTFHYNEDAVGIGLFITKNQIESLNGHISVESTVNEGTKFTIKF